MVATMPRRLNRGVAPSLFVAVVAVVLAGCSGGGQRRAVPARIPTPAPLVTAPTLPSPTVPPPPPATLVATARVPSVPVFAAPGADVPASSLANPNEFGLPLVFRVVTVQADWLQVMLPVRPNGSRGWVRAADVTTADDDWRMAVQLGAHSLTVWKGADVVRRETVAVGMPGAPTPTGDFYLTETLDTGSPSGAYGPWAFGLSAFSDVYTEFAGGPGQIGLHGTNQPDALGGDVSHGCIRVTNEAITDLAGRVPAGTPIAVVP